VARELAAAGRGVASTLSYGIDTAAQHGAQAAGAPTLAVLPCGLDNCHPRNQAELMMRVLSRGGVAVSAYRPGTETTSDSLAYSARLLAALSSAVVLVEPSADIRTVPLKATQAASEMGRPVFVMTAAGPAYALPPNGQTERLLTKVKACRTDSAATIIGSLT
jgi:DNA processing protein